MATTTFLAFRLLHAEVLKALQLVDDNAATASVVSTDNFMIKYDGFYNCFVCMVMTTIQYLGLFSIILEER